MGTAGMQGGVRGPARQEHAEISEGMFLPLYERIFAETGVATGTMVLDVSCGPGLAAHLAAKRGALVSGLDAAKSSVTMAQSRTTNGDFRVGEMEHLPWFDSTFDVVTGFNSFQFTPDPVNALREAKRVARPWGRLAMTVWGPDDRCETTTTIAAIYTLLPASHKAERPPTLSGPSDIEDLMMQAGLDPVKSGEVTCSFLLPDLETAVRGFMDSGVAKAATRKVGADPVRHTIKESLTPFRTPGGAYRQRNTFWYTIASPLRRKSEID